MSDDFSVTRYWCSTTVTGNSMPAISPTWRAQSPAALTAISQPTSPWSVTTRVMRPSAILKPVTVTPSTTLTPPARAPLA